MNTLLGRNFASSGGFNHFDDRYNVWIVCFAALCVTIPIFLLGEYITRTPIVALTQDYIHELRGWARGEVWWERIRRNDAASWFVAAALYLDVYLGPAGAWFRIIAYSLLAIFTYCFWFVSNKFIGKNTALVFVSLWLIFWFIHFNSSSAYFYIWRVVEASSQLAAVGTSIYLISRYKELENWKISGLIALSFVFSQIHIGYAVFISLLAVLLILDDRKTQRVAYSLLSVSYFIFMIFIDRTFADLWQRFTVGGVGTDTSPFDLIITFLDLVTYFFNRAFEPLLSALPIIIIKTFFIISTIGLTWQAAYKTIFQKDSSSAIFLLIFIASAGSAFLAVLGRYNIYGPDAASIPRFFSYSLMSVFAVFWYVLSKRKRYLNIVLLTLGLTVSLFHIERTRNQLSQSALGNGFRVSSYTSYLMHKDDNLIIEALTPKDFRSLRFSADILIKNNTLGYPKNLLDDFKSVDSQSLHNAPRCDGRTTYAPAKPNTDFYEWNYQYLDIDQAPFDYALSLGSDEPVALSRDFTLRGKGHVKLYVPEKVIDTTLVLFRYEGRQVKYVCTKSLIKPDKHDEKTK